jgi:hypothetical protein
VLRVLAYCLYLILKHWIKPLASGLTPRPALDQFAKAQMLDVVLPTTGDKQLVMSRSIRRICRSTTHSTSD